LNNMPFFFALLHYNWYMIWRIFGLISNNLINSDKQRSDLIKGYFDGWKLTFLNLNKIKKYIDDSYWKREAYEDIYRSR